MEFLLKQNMEKVKPLEEKKEHELDIKDRMTLLNKQMDETFVNETYTHFLNSREHMNTDSSDKLVQVNDYVYDDIEFFHDHYGNTEKGLFNRINCCETQIGTLLLKRYFKKLYKDSSLLERRQDCIQNISKIHNELTPLLKSVKEIEKDLLWFWNQQNMRHIDLMNDFIFFNYDFIPFYDINGVLNNNKKALFYSNIYKIIVSPILTIITPILSLLIPLILLLYFQRKSGVQIPVGQVIGMYFKTIVGDDSFRLLLKNPTQAFIASMLTKGLYVFMYFQNIYYSVQSSMNTHKIINIIHDKCNKMSDYIKNTRAIHELCKKMDNFDFSSFYMDAKLIQDFDTFENLFYSKVFNYAPSLFSDKGEILCTFQKFKMLKENMVSLFYFTGVVDCVNSLYTLMKSSSMTHPYSYTTFNKSVEPSIKMKEIWHPYLDKEIIPNVVKNDLDMTKHMLITGPNAAGKSTFIKAVILNILLSQTFGISSTSSFLMTPFHLIETYLHIPDSKGSSSLFEAEMLRSKEYIERMKALGKDQCAFIVLDEIFSSTNFVEGFSGAYSILKKLATFKQTMAITTTHYTDLEVLEEDTSENIMNYKFDVNYDEQRNIHFNYKLQRGVSKQYIALDLLKRNGFDKDIIDEAINMCEKIRNKKMTFFHDSERKLKNPDDMSKDEYHEYMKEKEHRHKTFGVAPSEVVQEKIVETHSNISEKISDNSSVESIEKPKKFKKSSKPKKTNKQ